MAYRWIMVAGLLALPPHQALAWGKEAEGAVALLATQSLTPKAAGKVKALLALGHEDSLESAAPWADRIVGTPSGQGTESWHSDPIPPEAKAYDKARDCHGDNCAVEQVGHWSSRLRNGSQAEKVFALKFLVNLVGVVHDPVRNAAGIGAKPVKLDGETMTLQALWDEKLTAKVFGTEDAGEIAARLARERPDITKPRAGTPAEWATDSHQIAVKTAYGALAGKEPCAIGPDYVEAVRPVVREQLAKAGLRLARILNEALEYDPPAEAEDEGQGVVGKE